MARLVVAGEALVDLVIEPDGRVDAKLGGAPFNTARAAARLGAQVGFLGALSNDRFGTLLRAALMADGVEIQGPVSDRPTTLAAAELDERGAAKYRFYIDGTSAPDLTAADVGHDAELLFTGGLGLVLEPMATTLVDAVGASADRTLVMVDVNCRPLVIGDRQRYLDRIATLMGRADVVKVSDDDLDYLAPGVPTSAAAAHLVEQGAGAVLITAGAAHTTVVTAGDTLVIDVPPLRSAVVDTIGAGDTFGGALLAWWSARGLGREDVDAATLADAVRAAHAAAAIVVTRRGADPPRRQELPDDWV